MIVMKFGGTSVENAVAIDRVAGIVRKRLGHRPVVVVSAMAKVTDGLLEIARLAAHGKLADALERCEAMQARHQHAVAELIPNGGREPVLAEINKQFGTLAEIVKGIAAVGECSPRTSDYVASFGELLSS